METQTLFLVSFASLMSLVFLLNSLADYLNLRSLSDPLPEEFSDTFDEASYQKMLHYQRSSTQFGLLERLFIFGVTIGFLVGGGLGWIDQMIAPLEFGPIASGLIFFGILSVLRFLLHLPFQIYETFVLEEKSGFNRITPLLFVSDFLKGTLLSVLIGVPFYAGIYWFFEETGSLGWLVAWAFVTVFQIILIYLAPTVIMPLFNRFTPLTEGETLQEIKSYAQKQGFALSGIFTMDASKRSTKSNAFFTGFGKSRRLVLFDSLLEKQTPQELCAVVAHEIGHYKHQHILKSLFLSLLPTAFFFYLLGFTLNHPLRENVFTAFSIQNPSFHAGIIIVSLFFNPIMRLLGVFTQKLSRRFEFQADSYSAQTYQKPEALISALKKLTRDNLAHLTPHPFKVALDYSHPPVLERVLTLRKEVQK